MLIIIVEINNKWEIREINGPVDPEMVPDIGAIIASSQHLDTIRDQFLNIPFNTVKRDMQTWHGEMAKFIASNYVWENE